MIRHNLHKNASVNFANSMQKKCLKYQKLPLTALHASVPSQNKRRKHNAIHHSALHLEDDPLALS